MLAGAPFLALFVFMLGSALFLRGLFGRPEWAHPSCATCRYDLRGLDPAQQKQCPECGADLRRSRGVHFARTKRSARLMTLGVIIALSPIVFIGSRQAQSMVLARIAQYRSNDAVIAGLAGNPTDRGIWNELLDRYYDGRLSDEDVAAAIDHLVAHLEAAGGAGNQPLQWSGQFLAVVLAENRVSDEQFERLCRAYYSGKPEMNVPARVRSGEDFQFNLRGSHWDLDGVTTVYALREVTLDNQSLTPTHAMPGRPSRRHSTFSGSGPWGINGNLMLAAEPGERELVFAIDFGVIESHLGRFTHHAPPGPVEEWPETIFHETLEVRVPIVVLGPEESPIALVAPPRHREAIGSGLRVTGLRIGYEHGMQMAELIFNPSPNPPVPLSFKVFIRAGDVELDMGSFRSQGGGMSRSGFRRTLRGQGLPDVPNVDVVFRPDPKAVEGQAEWTEIWGEEIVIENVQVIRPASQSEMDEQAMRAALHVHAVDPGWQDGRRTRSPTLHMNPVSTPVPARFRVYIRSGEYEHQIATITSHSGGSTRRGGPPAVDLPPKVQTVTIIFRPDLDELEEHEREGHWDKEIIFEDVPVIRDPHRGGREE